MPSLVNKHNDQRRKINGAAILCIAAASALIAGVFLWMLSDLLRHGLPEMSLEFLTGPVRDAGRAGGIGPVWVSTLLILAVCLSVSLPIGLGTAILLAEFISPDNRFGRMVRASLDMLAGVPSILFGLFGNAFFSVGLGLGFSILSGGLTLACMVLPLFIGSSVAALQAVPHDHRRAGAALGLPRSALLARVVLPCAAPGLAAGVVLSTGRALAETAALLFTSGYVARMPRSVFDSGRSLSIHIHDLAMNVPGGVPRAHATALVLILLVLVINLLTRGLMRLTTRTL